MATICLTGIVAVVWVLFRQNSIDDAYVTYRFAENVAAGRGLVYNLGDHTLSTTSPLYALLLGFAGKVYENIPATSNFLSCLALLAGSCSLLLIGRRFNHGLLGFIAAVLYALSPFTTGSIGMETNLYLALVLGGMAAYFHDRLYLAAILLAPTTMLRGDAAIPIAVMVVHYLWTKRRVPIGPVLLFLAVSAPFFVYQTVTFGSPMPVTLAAKQAQLRIGWPDYLEGFGEWASIYWQQSWLYVFIVPTVLLGLFEAFKRQRWLLVPVAWAVCHAAFYQFIGVASYFWYYAPLVPALVLLVAAGCTGGWRLLVDRIGGKPKVWRKALAAVGPVLAIPIIVAMSTTAVQAYRQFPDARFDVYHQVGRWMEENTSPDATLGVMEVGIMGYYADRWTVDFLGLVRKETVDALNHKDIYWTLFHFQPDYIALVRENSFWGYPIFDDEWFADSYRPVRQFSNSRFSNGPITLYERVVPQRQPMRPETSVQIGFGDAVSLDSIALGSDLVMPGGYFVASLGWEQGVVGDKDYAATLQLIREDGTLLALSNVQFYNTMWKKGQTTRFYHRIKVPADTPPGKYDLALAVYDPGNPEDRLEPSAGTEARIASLGKIEVVKAAR